jgi:hypothetical protein
MRARPWYRFALGARVTRGIFELGYKSALIERRGVSLLLPDHRHNISTLHYDAAVNGSIRKASPCSAASTPIACETREHRQDQTHAIA